MIRGGLAAAGLLAPASAVVTVSLVLPLALLFRFSLNRFVPGEFMVEALTVENYAKFASDPYYLAVLRTTLLMAAGVMLACLALAFPVATLLARAKGRPKTALLHAVVLPLFVGNALRAAGWMVAFGQRAVVGSLMEAAQLPPVALMYTPAAVFVGILSVNLPFVVLTLSSVLEGIEESFRGGAQPGRHALRGLAPGDAAAQPARRAGGGRALLRPDDERLRRPRCCSAGCASG